MKTKIFHVEFSKAGLGLSGGEKCMVELIRYFKKKNICNILLTTDNGKELYTKLGLVEDENLKYITIKSFITEQKYHIFVSYIFRVFMYFKIKPLIIKEINYENDILMCHSEFFPNTIACHDISKKFKKKVFYWFHMLAPDVFKGFEGHFTNQYKIPTPALIHYKLNQLFFKYVSKKSTIITVNPYYEFLFKKNDTYILKKFGGESIFVIKKYSGVTQNNNIHTSVKKYDIAFMGRFHPQKGLFEIIEILKILKKIKPDIKLLLIGGGNEAIKKKFFDLIHAHNFNDNIEYAGFISSDEKFELLSKSKVFIFPSYYESFGQVALEAMACGLPVVAYNLPVYDVFEKGMIKVPIRDNEAFASEIMSLLNHKTKLEEFSKVAKDYSSTFSWDKTGEEVYNLLNLNETS